MLTSNVNTSRRICSVIIAIAMFFTVFAVIPFTNLGKSYAAGETGKVTASLLYVRSGAGTGYSKLGSMSKGKIFTVTGTAKDSSGVTWYKLNFNSRNGYVSSKYVDIINSTVNNTAGVKGTVTTKKDPLIVRSGPAKSYSSLGTMAKGKVFDITGSTKDSSGRIWYRLNFNGKTGYVSSEYVKTTSVVTPMTNTTGTVTTKTDPLIVRSGAGTGFSKLGTIAKGKTFDVTGQTQDNTGLVWYVFDFNGKTGYVSSKYVTIETKAEETPAPAPEEKPDTTPETKPDPVPEEKPDRGDAEGGSESAQPEVKKTGKVNTKTDPLIIRSGPAKSYKNIGTIPKGKTFTILEEQKDSNGTAWYKLTYGGKTGYVCSDYVIVETSSDKPDQGGDEANKPETVKIGKVNTKTDPLIVRSGPAKSYKNIGSLLKGKTFTILGEEKDSAGTVWYRLSYIGKTGYVCSDYVIKSEVPAGSSDAEDAAPAEPVTFKMGTTTAPSGLNVRTGPGTGYSRLATLPKGTIVTVTGSAKASDGKVWYTYQYSSSRVGYLCSDYLTVKTVTSDSEFETYLNQQGFPESYKASLRALHAEHPQWIFKAKHIGYTWDEVLNKQTSNMSANLIDPGSPVSYRNPDSYNSSTKTWYQPDSGWYVASDSVVAHYMDPRNFLGENSIFQFMPHTYDGSSQNESTVAKVIDGSFMESRNPGGGYSSYKALINTAGKNSGVNPNVLAAMIIQEQGWNGSSLTSGNYSGYKGYYNFFNIGAYKGDGMNAVERGLWYAKGGNSGATSYSRPWNTPYKSILGGAQFYKDGYLDMNQYTYYTKRFNVMNGLSKVGTGQYMTYVAAAANEGSLLRRAYAGNNSLPIVFEIPVYMNMPSMPCPLQ